MKPPCTKFIFFIPNIIIHKQYQIINHNRTILFLQSYSICEQNFSG